MELQGHALVIALSRTPGEVEVSDRYGRTSRMSPSASIHLVCEAEGYVGSGSKRRVRSIVYQEPPPRPIKVLDNGFSGFNRYPLPDQSTEQRELFLMTRAA